MIKKYFVWISLLPLIFSCTASRFVKPLQKKQVAIGADFGGPLIKLSGAVFPIPITTIYAGYGIDSTLTGFASVHTTSAAFGNLQTDIGLVKQIFSGHGWMPSVSVTPAINLISQPSAKAFNAFPQIDINAYWNCKHQSNFIYVGMANWFDFEKSLAFGVSNNNTWLPTLQAGHTWVGSKWNFVLEAKWLAINKSNKDIVVDYLQNSISKNGASGVYFSVIRKF